ncbi:MAG TPA: transglutaminase-like domain-containing protein [Methylomirabilota bacterium]|nr:transglutaminase-like domain-containing protein [Methylomirabilota bacterium]
MPPLLLGVGLAFWGWQTGVPLVGLAMALVLEARTLVHSRWDLQRADFNRVSDFSTVLLVLTGVYQFVANDSARAMTGLIQWLPLLLFPVLACQLYSVAGGVETAVFFWSQRTRPDTTTRVDLGPPYFVLSLLSASAANAPRTFYGGLVVLAAWALWSVRGRSPLWRWILAVLVAVGIGWAGHLGLAAAQRVVERRAQALFLSWMRRDPDPSRTATSLGEIGELKLSDRIVMRVERGGGTRVPLLLRQASYNAYHAPAWIAVDGGFTAVLPEADGATWLLRRDATTDARLTISAYLARGRGLLALPSGAARLDDLMVVSLARSRLGAVRVDEGLGLVTFTAEFARHGSDESPPTAGDVRVPPRETEAITQVAAELDLAGRPPAEAIARVRQYFRERFRYTRYLGAARPGRTALEDFLLTTRAGHCEYFATATTLLLRASGVPARYTVGYAVHQWSPVEHRWVVRARDAHAWASAWVGGAWVDVDTTPASWIDEEAEAPSLWGSINDLWEWGSFAFARWRWSERQDRLTGNLGWLLIPLTMLLVWRLWARRRVAAAAPPASAPPPVSRAGDDSEFYAVERRLGELGFARAPDVSLARWLDAILAAAPPALATAPLVELLALHYRHRFDPAGLPAAERRRLSEAAAAWLAAHPPAPASASAAAP